MKNPTTFAAAAALTTLLTTSAASAAKYVVTDANDQCAVPAKGTLRRALIEANRNPGPDTIVIDALAAGRTTLLCGCLPAITDPVRIDGSSLGDDLVIDASKVSGCTTFDFDAGLGASHDVAGRIVLRGGRHNRAVHVRPGQSVRLALSSIERTMLDGDLGAVLTEGELVIERTRIAGNTGGKGGAVAVLGGAASLLLSEVTIERNTAAIGGAIWIDGGKAWLVRSLLANNGAKLGGAVSAGGGVLVLEASTLSGNAASSAGGAIFGGHASIELHGSTIAFNRAASGASGLELVDSAVYAHGTIISGGAGPGCAARGWSSFDGDYNIDGDRSCGFDGIGNKKGVDPELAPLKWNGGATRTHAIPFGGEAHDAGDEACEPLDQRGAARPMPSTRCDIGAYERQDAAPARSGGRPPVIDVRRIR